MIANHLEQCRYALQRCSQGSPRHPFLTLGDLRVRCTILKNYIENLGPLPENNLRTIKAKFHSIFGNQEHIHRYNPPLSFICEEYSVILRRIYHELQGGMLTHKNGETLFKLLNMQQSSQDPEVVRIPTLNTTAVKCPNCDTVFLICGEGRPNDIMEQVMLLPLNPIGLHMSIHDHESPLTQRPMTLHLDKHKDIPVEERIVLMKAVYTALGYECISNNDLVSIPTYVRKGLERYLQKNVSNNLSPTDINMT